MNAKNEPRGLSRKILLMVCTGVLALAFSAIPLLALWLDDVQLLAQPHERTRQAGALALSSDDLYLTRILKKYSQASAVDGRFMTALGSPGNMSWTYNATVQNYLDDLYEANVLPRDWYSYCSDNIEESYTSTDSLNFVHYISYVADATWTRSEFCYTVGLTVESESQKVIALWVSVPPTPGFPPPAQATLEAFRAYLGLEEFDDWEDPADTWFAGCALYSPHAETMLFCETGSYESQSYVNYKMEPAAGYRVSQENRTDHYYPRNYYCLSASYVPEGTVRSWQEYARSFFGETDVWHRGAGTEEAGAENYAGEAPLG